MDINKALEHIGWKLKNVWKATQKDVDAFNSILDYKDLVETRNLSENESLAKLWIHQLILLNQSGMYNGQRSIQVIDEILERSVYDWVMRLRELTPLMRFNNVGKGISPINTETLLNRTKMINTTKEMVSKYETELTEALKYEISEEDMIKFVNLHITRIINKFEK